jgi:AraC-like DNA-binding protein
MVPAEDVLGTDMQQWEERLQEQPGDLQKILLLEQLLTGLIRDLPMDQGIVNSALTLIRDHPDELSIQTICRQTGWYYKKLERAFNRTVGYTPKQYCRIIRFNAAIRQIGQYKKAPLTKISHACGYYDQSHFIRDFHRYAGTAPGAFQPGEHTIADFLIRYQPV